MKGMGCCLVFLPVLLLLLAAISRKIWIGQRAMEYVRRCSHQIALHSLAAHRHFNSTLSSLSNEKPNLVIFLNRHILAITLNWLCNTRGMEGVHSRLLLATMDPTADRQLARFFPKVARLNLGVPCLRCPFNYGNGPYQLFFVLRANIARALVEFGKPFWMVQQDTFWRLNLLALGLEQTNAGADVLFDRADQNAKSRLIAGGYFFVRPTAGSKAFFTELAHELANSYTPDNTLMSSKCADGTTKCAFIPFQTIANWQWIEGIHHNGAGGWSLPPALIQFDGETVAGGKLAKMRLLGFYFLRQDGEGGRICDTMTTVERASKKMMALWQQPGNSSSPSSICRRRSYSQWQFAFYQTVIGELYEYPVTEWLLNNAIYPYAHYFMITI